MNSNNFYPNNTKRRKPSDQDVEPGEITSKFNKPRNYGDNLIESQSPVRVSPFNRTVSHHKKPGEFTPEQLDGRTRIIPRDDMYHRQPSIPMVGLRRERSFRDPNFRSRGDQYYNESDKYNFPEKERDLMYERESFREHDIVDNPNYEYTDRNPNFRDSLSRERGSNWSSWRERERDREAQNISLRGSGGVRKGRNWTDQQREKEFRIREMRRHNLMMDRKHEFQYKQQQQQQFRTSSTPNLPHLKEELPNTQDNLMEENFHKKRWDNPNLSSSMPLDHRDGPPLSISLTSLPKVAPVSAMKDFKKNKDRDMENESPMREDEPPPTPKFMKTEEVPETDEILPTKQEIIQDMDKLDMEMGEIKAELEKLRKLKAYSHKPKDKKNLTAVERILLENQEKALEHTKLMKEYEIESENKKVHHLMVYNTDSSQNAIYRPRMIHYLRRRMYENKRKEKLLAEEYLYHKYLWETRIKSLNLENNMIPDNSEEESAQTTNNNNNNNSSSSKPDLSTDKEITSGIYTTRRTSRIRSCREESMEKNDSMKDDEITMRYLKTLAASVPMIIDEVELATKFIDENRSVDDPLLEYQRYKLTNPWTVEEQEIFLKNYLLYPKNFFKIASYLQNKSIEDVISFYYQNKLRLELKKQLSKKRQRRFPRAKEFREESKDYNSILSSQASQRRERARLRAGDIPISPILQPLDDKKEKEKKGKEELDKKKPKPSLGTPKTKPASNTTPKESKVTGRKRPISATNSPNLVGQSGKSKKVKQDSPTSSPSLVPSSPSSDDISPISSPRRSPRSPSPSKRKVKGATPKPPASKSKTNKPRSPSPRRLVNSSPTPKVRSAYAVITFCEDDTPTPWNDIERDLFKRAYTQFFLDFKAIADYIGTKNQFQCRSYYYNTFQFLNPSSFLNINTDPLRQS